MCNTQRVEISTLCVECDRNIMNKKKRFLSGKPDGHIDKKAKNGEK